MDKLRTVPLNLIRDTRYFRILNYPAQDDRELDARLSELANVGVTALRFVGPSMVEGLQILGKGCVGLVTQAVLEGELVGLKIRRLDSDRPNLGEETRLLRIANSVKVGPQLITATNNFLVMELIDGIPLLRWAEAYRGRVGKVMDVLSSLLDQCFVLDAIGLDHGELSRAPKNVLVRSEDDPCIVDFETASLVRRTANVTSILQYFLFGNLSKALRTFRVFPRKGRILRALADYKHETSVDSYHRLRETLGLQSF